MSALTTSISAALMRKKPIAPAIMVVVHETIFLRGGGASNPTINPIIVIANMRINKSANIKPIIQLGRRVFF